MKIELVYHKSPYTGNPRGGELSVRAIVEYLRDKGHDIGLSPAPVESKIKEADLVLTWAKPALHTALACYKVRTPLVTMVRFWKNICPLPAGNLMKRAIEKRFTEEKAPIFNYSSAIITNNVYAKNVIERWQPISKGKVHVSFVPIVGKFNQSGDKDGYLTIVTPEIYGESQLIKELTKLMPNERFLTVNTSGYNRLLLKDTKNVEIRGYMNMDEVWSQTKALLLPIYRHDVCGTSRVVIEAIQHGIPVIASNRCGLSEKIPPSMLVSRNAKHEEWFAKITDINANYRRYCNVAKKNWEKYDTQGNLEKFEKILLDSVMVNV